MINTTNYDTELDFLKKAILEKKGLMCENKFAYEYLNNIFSECKAIPSTTTSSIFYTIKSKIIAEHRKRRNIFFVSSFLFDTVSSEYNCSIPEFMDIISYLMFKYLEIEPIKIVRHLSTSEDSFDNLLILAH